MTLIRKDRVAETSTTTGTGPIALAGAIAGYQAFDAVMAVGDTCYYAIEAIDANGVPTGAWETGLGTKSATATLTRTTVHASSNADAAVNFAAGTKRVFITETLAALVAARALKADLAGANTFTATQTFSVRSQHEGITTRSGNGFQLNNAANTFGISFNNDGTSMTVSAPIVVTGDVTVFDEAYGASWSGSLKVPTKKAVYNKIQSIAAYRFGIGFEEVPTASYVIARHVVVDVFTLAANMAGCVAKIATNPTASFVVDLRKNGVSFGSITISTAGAMTFATTSGAAVNFAVGDVITALAPATVDATAAGFAATFKSI